MQVIVCVDHRHWIGTEMRMDTEHLPVRLPAPNYVLCTCLCFCPWNTYAVISPHNNRTGIVQSKAWTAGQGSVWSLSNASLQTVSD